jgi:hypothetical protein
MDSAALMRKVEREINERHGLPKGTISANPLKALLQLAAGEWPDGYVQACIAGRADDIKGKVVPINIAQDAAKVAARFIYPQLTAGEMSGPGGGPIPVSTITAELAAEWMKIPAMRRQLEDIQLAISRDARKALDAPATIVSSPAVSEVILDGDPD